jgi:hypothetical protein
MRSVGDEEEERDQQNDDGALFGDGKFEDAAQPFHLDA